MISKLLLLFSCSTLPMGQSMLKAREMPATSADACFKGLWFCPSHVNVSDASHQEFTMYACAYRISGLLANTSMERLWLTTSHLQALASRLSYIKSNCTGDWGVLSWLHMMGPCIEQLSEPVDGQQQ